MSNIITFDGPAASGKGTAGKMMAEILGFAYLDSGALYRVLAYDCIQMGVCSDNKRLVGIRAHGLDIVFGSAGQIILRGRDISQDIRTEEIGKFASVVSAYQKVREELLQKQLDFASGPGLVADGRDMGTEIFPDAIFNL